MNNHFHLVLETPNADLVAGMRWLLSSYTIRLNHRHCLFGHVLSRRYKAVIVDGGGDHYLGAAYDYVHLNPVRGKLLSAEERLSGCPWSSLVWYAAAREHRPAWVRVDRLLGEHQIFEDTAAGRQEFGRCMEGRRAGEMNEEELTALLLGQWDRRQNLVRDFSPMATRNCGMIPWRSLANVCHDPHGRNNATTPTAKRTAKSVANPWSDGVQDALLSFLLLDPTALAATDPRPNYPTAFYDAPQGRLVEHTDWSANAAMLDFRCSWISINHQEADGNAFEFDRKGEWLTKNVANYDINGEGLATDYHNTLSLKNWCANGIPTSLGWWEGPAWANGSQWQLGGNAGDPTATVSAQPGYTCAPCVFYTVTASSTANGLTVSIVPSASGIQADSAGVLPLSF